METKPVVLYNVQGAVERTSCRPRENHRAIGFQVLQLGIAIPDLNFQSGLSNFQSRDPRRDWRSRPIVKTTKIAKWVTVFGSVFFNYKCLRSCYGFSADVS